MDSKKLARITLLGLTIFVVAVIGICTLVEMKNKEPLTDDTKIIKTEEIDSTTEEEELEASEHILICNVDNKEIKGGQIELYMWTYDSNEGQRLYIQNRSDYYIDIKLQYEHEDGDWFDICNYDYQDLSMAPTDISLIERAVYSPVFNHPDDTFKFIKTHNRNNIIQDSKDGGLSVQGYNLNRVTLFIYDGPDKAMSHIATVWLSMEDIEIKEVY